MSDLAGSVDWIRLGDNLCVVLRGSQLAHFQDCTAQASLEDNFNLCIVLGTGVGSLRTETMLCSLVGVHLKEGCLIDCFSGKMAKCERK